jgi:hypothetical protein
MLYLVCVGVAANMAFSLKYGDVVCYMQMMRYGITRNPTSNNRNFQTELFQMY